MKKFVRKFVPNILRNLFLLWKPSESKFSRKEEKTNSMSRRITLFNWFYFRSYLIIETVYLHRHISSHNSKYKLKHRINIKNSRHRHHNNNRTHTTPLRKVNEFSSRHSHSNISRKTISIGNQAQASLPYARTCPCLKSRHSYTHPNQLPIALEVILIGCKNMVSLKISDEGFGALAKPFESVWVYTFHVHEQQQVVTMQ